jgi:hypothetical protein
LTLHQVQNVDPPPPRRVNPQIHRELETICLKCLEKDADTRYHSAGALAADLRRFLGGDPIRARSAGGLERSWRWCRRNPLVAGLCLAVGLLLAGLILVTVMWMQGEREVRRRSEALLKTVEEINDVRREIAAAKSADEIFGDLSLEETTEQPVQVRDMSDLADTQIPFLLENLKHQDARVRQQAAEVLGELETHGRAARDELWRAAQDDSSEKVRQAATVALRRISSETNR